MNSVRKTANLYILFIFVFVFIAFPGVAPLFGEEPLPSEELLLSEAPSPDEEPLLNDEILLAEESPAAEESPLTEDTLPGEEILLSEDSSLNDETLLAEESLADEEPLLSEESQNEETLFAEESLSDEELLAEEEFLDEESLLAEEPLLSEDPFFDDDLLFFEALPLIIEAPPIYTRSFDEIFPGVSRRQRRMIMSTIGLRNTFGKDDSPNLVPASNSGINLFSSVMQKDPSHLIELLMVVPYSGGELDMLDVYNAVGRTENIKDQSMTINGRDINFFVESTRIESARNRRAIPDPPQADLLPYSETMYLRLKEVYFGNLFLRGEISINLYGITYTMTNFTDIRYLLLPIMRAERLSIQLYLEPLKEGVLVYCMSGFYLPGFIANVDLSSSINVRMSVLINWLVDSIRVQESIAAENAVTEISSETLTNQ